MTIADWVDPVELAAELDVVRDEFAAADAAIELLPGPQGDPGITVSATPPPSPAVNDLWLDIS